MHLDLGFIRRQGKAAAWISGTGPVIPLVLGVGIGFLAPPEMIAEGVDHMVFALFLGVALCVSAIPVIAKILMEMRLLHRGIGQLILSSAVIDDVVGWFLLSVVSALATAGARPAGPALTAVAMLAGLVLVARCSAAGWSQVLRAADRGGSATTIAPS